MESCHYRPHSFHTDCSGPCNPDPLWFEALPGKTGPECLMRVETKTKTAVGETENCAMTPSACVCVCVCDGSTQPSGDADSENPTLNGCSKQTFLGERMMLVNHELGIGSSQARSFWLLVFGSSFSESHICAKESGVWKPSLFAGKSVTCIIP